MLCHAVLCCAVQVLFNGITVGDVASWVDSLLVAYLLRFGASSFSTVEKTACKERQLAYTFQVGRVCCARNRASSSRDSSSSSGCWASQLVSCAAAAGVVAWRSQPAGIVEGTAQQQE
jgi:hypothetical protein